MARVSGDISLKYVTPTEFAITLHGLATGSTANSSPVDLSTLDNVVDVLVGLACKTAAGSLGTDAHLQLYAAGSPDGINYPATLDNKRGVGSPIVVSAADTQEYSNLYSLAEAFGGVVPPKFQLTVENQTGLALSATDAENNAYYIVVYASVEP